jgi:hypothetical protein
MRDKIMDTEYFQEYILQQKNRILKFSTKLDNAEVREDRIFPVKKKIDAIKYSIFEAEYSNGEYLDKLRLDFLDIIRNMPKYWNPVSGYLEMLWMLSIAIMFEVDGEEWDILSQLVYDSNINDWLLGYLLSSRDGNHQFHNWQIKMQNPYEYLKNIIVDSQQKVTDIQDYLENKWYDAHNEMAWYDIHKNKEKLYSGYWSYESGAIVKILGLDDNCLKNVLFYPFDLAHYSR